MSLNASLSAPERLSMIRDRMAQAAGRINGLKSPELIAVSKTFGADDILPLLEAGQRHFGENRVQEAQAKWPALKADYPDVVLHLIGPLQTNKAREAVALFDVIHSVDRDKLAGVLRTEMDRAGKTLPCFVQVNIGAEAQKAGIAPEETADFVTRCRDVHGLNIVGLMCIPPADLPPGPFFGQLVELARQSGVEEVSIGMSSDFETAILMGATHIRVGSALFGTRTPH